MMTLLTANEVFQLMKHIRSYWGDVLSRILEFDGSACTIFDNNIAGYAEIVLSSKNEVSSLDNQLK